MNNTLKNFNFHKINEETCLLNEHTLKDSRDNFINEENMFTELKYSSL